MYNGTRIRKNPTITNVEPYEYFFTDAGKIRLKQD